MSLTRKIALHTMVQFASKFVAIIFGVLTVGLMTRYLGQNGFGQYSTITAFLQFFGILVDFGLQLSMVHLMSNPNNDANKIFNNTLTLRVISAGILFIFAPLIALALPYDQVIKQGMFILALNYFALAVNQVLIGLFQKELQMHKVAISEIIGRILLLGGVWYAIVSNMGLNGILLAIVLASAIQIGLLYYYARKTISISWSFEWQVWKQIMSASWPIAISIAFNLIYFKADTVILSLTRTQAEVGIYSAPYRMLEILISFPFLFAGLMLPILSQAWVQGDRQKYQNYFQKMFDVLVIVSIPLIAGTLPLADRIMVLIAGKDFAVSGIVLQIIIFATALIFLNAAYGYSIIVLNKQKQMIGAYIFTAIVALALYIIYIPKYSYIAAAYITILAEAMMLTANVIVSTKASKFVPKLSSILKSLTASIVMVLFIYKFFTLPLLVILILSVLVYFAVLYLVGGIKKETVIEILALKS